MAAQLQRVSFGGRLSPATEDELRRLYLRGHRTVPLLLAAVALAAYGWLPGLDAGPAFRLRITGFAAVVGLVATLSPRLWRLWWWSRLGRLFEGQVAGSAGEDGVTFAAVDGSFAVPWRRVVVAKRSAGALLLHVSRPYAYPLHRELFWSDDDWNRLLQALDERALRVDSYPRPGGFAPC